MIFNSFDFLVFFVIVTGLYFVLPHAFRWAMLLIASCIFYMYFIPWYILILFFTIIIDYFAGILIENAPPGKKKRYLVASLIANIGVLFFFKYFNFFADNVNSIAHVLGWNYDISFLKIVLPIGLSFHTFQAMSYTIEVYRGNQAAERHFGIYSLYVMYYPQLVAGPIERPQNLLHQFHTPYKFSYEKVSSGLKQMLWGFFKKVVIADRLAEYVNPVYNSPHDYQGITILIATIFFAIQIFCDFSGYSDIALGASRIMGIELMQNFKSPYLSKSISEFWSRWHISLSTWFKDYLYIPLGGNRVSQLRNYMNLLIVFLVSGLWHGANWTYVIWGGLHGCYLVGERMIGVGSKNKVAVSRRSKFVIALRILFVFILTCIAWIFFRAKDVSTGVYILKEAVMGIPHYISNLAKPGYLWLEPLMFNKNVNYEWFNFLIIILCFLILFWSHRKELETMIVNHINRKNLFVRWSFFLVLISSILVLGVFHNSSEFIYFQF